jgi:hypothetical protein
MGITHSLRDAELIASYLDDFLQQRSSWQQAMTTYSNVRMADYEEYWNFVCEGAQMDPYSPEQLAFFHSIKDDATKVNKLIAQIGDTISFRDAIEPGRTETPQFIRHFDAARLGYHQCIYAAEPTAMAS